MIQEQGDEQGIGVWRDVWRAYLQKESPHFHSGRLCEVFKDKRSCKSTNNHLLGAHTLEEVKIKHTEVSKSEYKMGRPHKNNTSLPYLEKCTCEQKARKDHHICDVEEMRTKRSIPLIYVSCHALTNFGR